MVLCTVLQSTSNVPCFYELMKVRVAGMRCFLREFLGGLFPPPPHLAHATCTLFFTSRVAFVCKKKMRSFRVFPPEN